MDNSLPSQFVKIQIILYAILIIIGISKCIAMSIGIELFIKFSLISLHNEKILCRIPH